MASKFMRSHNFPAITISTIITLATFIFLAGVIFNRIEVLEKEVAKLSAKIEAKENAYVSLFGSQEKALNDVRVTISAIEGRLPAVRGVTSRVASPGATLTVPSPIKVPTPTGKK